MNIVLNLKDIVLDLTHDQQIELSIYLLDGLFSYSEMYLDDGDDLQYRRLLRVKNSLERSIFAIKSIDPRDLRLNG